VTTSGKEVFVGWDPSKTWEYKVHCLETIISNILRSSTFYLYHSLSEKDCNKCGVYAMHRYLLLTLPIYSIAFICSRF